MYLSGVRNIVLYCIPGTKYGVAQHFCFAFFFQVSQLEMDRKTILQGCRSGFAACYDLFLGSATSTATAAPSAAVAGDGSEAGLESGNDIADIGPLPR